MLPSCSPHAPQPLGEHESGSDLRFYPCSPCSPLFWQGVDVLVEVIRGPRTSSQILRPARSQVGVTGDLHLGVGVIRAAGAARGVLESDSGRWCGVADPIRTPVGTRKWAWLRVDVARRARGLSSPCASLRRTARSMRPRRSVQVWRWATTSPSHWPASTTSQSRTILPAHLQRRRSYRWALDAPALPPQSTRRPPAWRRKGRLVVATIRAGGPVSMERVPGTPRRALLDGCACRTGQRRAS